MIGIDTLGLFHPKFPVRDLIEVIPSGWALGILDTRFGTDTSHLIQCLDSGKFPLVRIHLVWDEHSWKPANGHTKLRMIRRSRVFREIANRYPNVRFYISPFLEHNHDEETFRKAVKWIQSVGFSAEQIINTPMKGFPAGTVLREYHGPHTPARCSSLDGISIFDIGKNTLAKWKSQPATYTLAWDWSLNGKKNEKDKTDSMKRTAWPSKRTLQKIVKLMTGS